MAQKHEEHSQMDTKLNQIFKSDYNRTSFEKEVLLPIFQNSVKDFRLYDNPEPLKKSDLSATEKRIAEKIIKYGEFTTHDTRKVELYEITVIDSKELKTARVGLATLVKKHIIGNAAIFATFKYQNVTGKPWRFSFTAHNSFFEEAQVKTQETDPRRYTYVFGDKDAPYLTAINRFTILKNQPQIKLKDIQDAFSVEALNKEFYKVVAECFYQLLGEKTEKQNKQESPILQLPSTPIKDNKKVYQEFAVRLIGRTIFCWFLKMKKSANQKALLPQTLLSSEAVKDHPNYYHFVLEKLFFQTLNTPMNERIEGLPKGCEQIPFLNGGLFEPRKDDFYCPDPHTGLSQHLNTLKITNLWFSNLFQELEKYNFTLDEHSATEVEVSIDPEMLGRIFENLLAEIDPDSGQTARKNTGSFYTPREIVDYMATESLTQYLHNTTELPHERLRSLFQMTENQASCFSDSECEALLKALDQVKILDPACGSGAFPMGILQKIVTVLQAIDPEAVKWKERQCQRIKNPVIKEQLRQKLNTNSVEYAQKIGILQNSLYGADIQPIATEISRLRCFLTLIVDEAINDDKKNRGIEPLPNLDFKFVTADTLIKLPAQANIFESDEDIKKLKELREEYLQSLGENKERIKKEFIETQQRMFQYQIDYGYPQNDTQSTAYKLSSWNPFSHEKVDWFDPQWMFGIESFDILIGNPPYIKEYTNKKAFDEFRTSKYYQGKMDLWYGFACMGIDLLKEKGIECFIAQNNWTTSAGASIFRNKVLTETQIKIFTDFRDYKVFKAKGIQTMVYLLDKQVPIDTYLLKYSLLKNDATQEEFFHFLDFSQRQSNSYKYELKFESQRYIDRLIVFNPPDIENVINTILDNEIHFLYDKEVANGIHPHYDFINKSIKIKLDKLDLSYNVGDGIFGLKNSEIFALGLTKDEKQLIKRYYSETNSFHKYYGEKTNEKFIIYTDSSFKKAKSMNKYPNLKRHLDKFQQVITSDNRPYGLHRARKESFFIGKKIAVQRKCPKEPVFTYLDFDSYLSATFYIIKTDRFNLKYLTGLLNSKLIAFWLRYKGKMQGSNYQIDKEPLVNIPIIIPVLQVQEKIIALVDTILAKKKDNPQANTTPEESKIDALVYQLYGLSAEEIEIVEKKTK